MKGRLRMSWVVAGVLLLAAGPSRGVILNGTGDPTVNTNAPTGALAGSGWQYQGVWGGFLGTPIAPQWFITASHVGGSVGQSFTFDGASYTTISSFAVPNSDLTLWQVSTPFSTYAPLYTGSDETGKNLVVFGKGTRRGADVIVNSQLKGWYWGPGDGVTRWGENQVYGTVDYFGVNDSLLYATFDRGAGFNEAMLSVGDSSGGVFIQEGGQWKLAGINFAVDSGFSLTSGGPAINAALLDVGGLYYGTTAIPDQPFDYTIGFYSSRISTYLPVIQSVTGVPEPTPREMALGGLVLVLMVLVFRRRRAAV